LVTAGEYVIDDKIALEHRPLRTISF